MSAKKIPASGYFVNEVGIAVDITKPLPGTKAMVVNDNGRLRVDVVCSDGFVKQEASYYATLDDIANVVGKENVFLASPAFA